MSLPGLTAATAHEGLSRFEQGDRVLAGSVGHWHADGAKRVWVKGTVEGCEAGMGDLSDDDLLAKIREADEAIDPTPYFNTNLNINDRRFITYDAEGNATYPEGYVPFPHATFDPEAVPDGPSVVGIDHYGHWSDDKPEVTVQHEVKPQRGGKRTCTCDHSESRHNASGKCRTCDCVTFMVRDRP